MPFVTIGSISRYVDSDMVATVLLSSGTGARFSTAQEAADCLSRLVVAASGDMHNANASFKRDYTLSTNDIVDAPPGGKIQSTQSMLREYRDTEGEDD